MILQWILFPSVAWRHVPDAIPTVDAVSDEMMLHNTQHTHNHANRRHRRHAWLTTRVQVINSQYAIDLCPDAP